MPSATQRPVPFPPLECETRATNIIITISTIPNEIPKFGLKKGYPFRFLETTVNVIALAATPRFSADPNLNPKAYTPQS